jgi:hypothetical protein
MEYVTITEAARRARVSSKTIQRAIQAGKLVAHYPQPNRCEIEVAVLDTFLHGQLSGQVQARNIAIKAGSKETRVYDWSSSQTVCFPAGLCAAPQCGRNQGRDPRRQGAITGQTRRMDRHRRHGCHTSPRYEGEEGFLSTLSGRSPVYRMQTVSSWLPGQGCPDRKE